MSNTPQKVPEDAQRHHVEIDRGFRSWYESCPCCLSESYPEVKRALDDEKVIQQAQQAAKVQ